MAKRLSVLVFSSLALLLASPAFASFHVMKIEQAIGGVGGDTTQQAIQLRMRGAGQNLVGNTARIVAWDAAGANPVVLIAFTSNAGVGALGRRILVVSPAFAAAQTAIDEDFVMTNTIPASYLPAGRLTFESIGGTVYWSLAWGGAGYTGSHLGDTTNDADGNFGPAFAGALPSTNTSALLFSTADPTGSAPSVSNSTDYQVTAGAAVFTNNANQSGTVTGGTPQADLSITKADSPDPVTVSQPLSYTLTVTNLGPAAASSLTVADTLPAGTSFQNVSSLDWNCGESAGTVTCTRPTLAVGTAPVITIVVTAPGTPGTITNTATVSAATSDPVPGNNSDSEDTTVNTAVPQADLSITKSDGGVEGRWGQPLTYTLVASNGGPAAVNAATVTDNFPVGLSSVSWTCTASAGSVCPASGAGNVSASVDLLVAGTATFTATGTVDVGTVGPLVNTASVTVPGGVIDPDAGNNVATDTTPVGPIQFYTLASCRVADTRGAVGPSGGPALQANGTRSFPVAGRCAVPADARAVAITLTVVQESERGDLRLYPAGSLLPNASTINFEAAHVRANNAVVGLGTNGEITVLCDMAPGSTGTTHFLFDVFGYFR